MTNLSGLCDEIDDATCEALNVVRNRRLEELRTRMPAAEMAEDQCFAEWLEGMEVEA